VKAPREDIANVLHEAESVFISECQSKSIVTWYNSQQLKFKENCYIISRPVLITAAAAVAAAAAALALAFYRCFSC